MVDSLNVYYPELAETGGLSGALGRAASPATVEFTDLGKLPGPLTAVAVRDDRQVVVGLSVREREFLLTFKDAGTAWARAVTPDIVEVALASESWLTGIGLRELVGRWPFVTADELSLAYQEGNEVEVAWRLVRQEVTGTWSQLVEEAVARPELVSLFPIYSHGAFRVLRNSRFIGYDAPFVHPDIGGFTLKYKGRTLAEGDARHVVDALVTWFATHPE